ncbi:MAG: peptidylprolyl isomerase [Bryobacterales bacterium]|nr:peptidylprolyl isomerase [Bryobacterales bacterium]
MAGALLAQPPAQPAKPKPPVPAKPKAAAAPAVPAVPEVERETGLYATITTTMGVIVVKLHEKESPITVRNFTGLARGTKAWRDPKTGQMVRRPLYAGTVFHRVIPGFMIQGGDPTGTGAGDCGFVIPDEFHPDLKFDKPGRLAMANKGPKTGDCQFFITEASTPHLNGLHTIFAQVIEGQDVVDKIAATPRDSSDRPRTAVRMRTVTIKRFGPDPNPPKPAAPAAKKPAAPAAKKSAAPAAKKAAAPPAAKK